MRGRSAIRAGEGGATPGELAGATLSGWVIYHRPVVAAGSSAPEERCEHTDAAGYLKALSYLFILVALGGAVATAVRLRPPAIYWPLLIGLFVFELGSMALVSRHWVEWAVSGAASTRARLNPRPVSRAVVLPAAAFVLLYAPLVAVIAAVQPTFLGILSNQMLVFGVLAWWGSRGVRRWESQSGSRLLIVARVGADRSDFLVQTAPDRSGDRFPHPQSP